MNDTDGLLAEAQVEGDDNQQQAEETSIPHQLTDNEPSVDSVTVAKEGEEIELEKPEWYPEKFWNEDDGPDLENLVKSYNELQKKFSQGKHKSPDKYDTAIFEEAGIGDDDPLYSVYKDWAKENGVSQAAFEQLAGTFIEMAQGESQQAEISYKEEYEKLGPNADIAIKSMTDWASSLVRKGVWSDDDFEEFKIMGGTAQGLRALQKIRSYYGDKPVPIDVSPTSDAPSKEELMAMVGKPEYQSDPAYRAKVEKMFENVYGKQEYSAI
jgi:hypothetical protein|tara:strand:- start:1035 stop:1838 length:804 start_codon:yes stop_codon:yes gene_type:complete